MWAKAGYVTIPGGDNVDRVQEMMEENQELIDQEYFEETMEDVEWVNISCDYSCIDDILNI